MFSRQHLLCVLLLSPLAASLFSSSAVANDRANASFYIETFGRVDARQNPLVDRAEEIFTQLKRASGLTTASAKLVVIDTHTKPWAIALADGNVVLSRGALEIVYAPEHATQSDAWLAFVLGHELAHLGSRDLWQQHVFASLSALAKLEDSLLSEVQQSMTQSAFDMAAWRERELKADESGYVIAALAGFDVQQVFGNEHGREEFLTLWEKQTRAEGNTHYRGDVRTEFLRVRLKAAEPRLDQFQLGIMLAHAGRLDDALTLFEDFQSDFSSRGALANLGFVHLQLARESMPVALAYRFWLPAMLEPDSGLRIPSRQFSTAIGDKTRAHLEDAVRYLEQAQSLDPAERVVSVNLIAAYHYLDKHFRARAVLEDALLEHPDDSELIMLKALILVDQEPDIDMWPRAVVTLQSLDTGDSALSAVLFNLARLHQERERYGKATAYWTRLYERQSTLPGAYWFQVCAALDLECDDSLHEVASNHVVKTERTLLPVQPGDTFGDEHIQALVPTADIIPWQIQEISGTTLRSGTMTAFVFDNVVELLRYETPPQAAIDGLLKQRTPLDSRQLGQYRVQRYTSGLSLLDREGKLEEIWLTR